MSFEQATFLLHFIAQNVFPASYFVDLPQNRLIPHPLYPNLYIKIPRYTALSLAFIGLLRTVVHLIWLLLNWETYTYNHGNEAILYFIAVFALLILNYCNYLIVTKPDNRILYLTFACKLVPDNSTTIPKSTLLNKCTLKQLFVYGLSGFFLIAILSAFLYPFAISVDPVQIAMGTSIYAKVIAAITYGLVGSYSSWYILSTFTLYIAAFEKLDMYIRKLVYKLPQQTNIQPKPSHKFYKCFNVFQTSSVALTIGLESVVDFPFILVSAGVVLCSITTTGMLTMWGRINIMIYFLLPAISGICFSIALVVTHVGALPYVNALKCLRFWKYHLRERIDKRMLRTLRPFGFLMGPYGMCTKKLGLLICDDIINNTVSLLLMFQ